MTGVPRNGHGVHTSPNDESSTFLRKMDANVRNSERLGSDPGISAWCGWETSRPMKCAFWRTSASSFILLFSVARAQAFLRFSRTLQENFLRFKQHMMLEGEPVEIRNGRLPMPWDRIAQDQIHEKGTCAVWPSSLSSQVLKVSRKESFPSSS